VGELIRPLVSAHRLVLLLPDMYRLLDPSVHSVAFSVCKDFRTGCLLVVCRVHLLPRAWSVHCVIGNGVMEYYEFVDLMSRVPWGEQGSEEELSSAVHSLFDHEHDGLASVAEMRRLLTSVGEPLTDEELDVMVKQFSPDGDGKVTCDGNERSLTLHCIVALYARQACTRQCRNVICPAVQ